MPEEKKSMGYLVMMGVLWLIQVIVLPMVAWLALGHIEQGTHITAIETDAKWERVALTDIQKDLKEIEALLRGDG